MKDYTFILNRLVDVEETRHCEFKEIKGGRPLDTIKNTCDEYVVAFLNSAGGRIFWGIRDSDRCVVGVTLSSAERDALRRTVTDQLHQIKPPISPTAYQVNLYPVYEDESCGKTVDDKYVVEVVAPRVFGSDLYATGGGQVFVKTDSGKKLLSFQEVQDEIRRRQIELAGLPVAPVPQLSTIQEHSTEFSLTPQEHSTVRESLQREFSRAINRVTVYSFLDAIRAGAPAQFVYLLSLVCVDDPGRGEVVVRIELQCHITSFVHAFARHLDSLAVGSPPSGDRYPPDLRIRASSQWSPHVPYRVSMPGPNLVDITCLERPHYSLKFPMQTSDLLLVLSAMLTGRIIVQDDIQLGDPVQKSFVQWLIEAKKRQSFSVSDITLDVADPERWLIKSGGIQ
jgi:Putative DNA-binding domain